MSGRVPWQANAKNKISGFWDEQATCRKREGQTSGITDPARLSPEAGSVGGVLSCNISEPGARRVVTRPGRRRLVSRHERRPPLHDQRVLILDNGGIARGRAADLEVLPFDNPLRARNLATHHRMVDRLQAWGRHVAGWNQPPDAVADQQVVIEADEEARLARIALPAAQRSTRCASGVSRPRC